MLQVRRLGAERVSALAVIEEELGLLSYEAVTTAERELEQWQERGYEVLAPSDQRYPANLRVVENHPPLLFVEGALQPEDRRGVSVIGTRQPSDAGKSIAREVAEALAFSGHPVVSGLAAGIDAEAHRAALKLRTSERARDARTLAVLGNGLGCVYPPEHALLQAQIAEHGALVTQFWPGAEPTRRTFPARNALMSGLTLGSVIIEAGEHSGTRIQARHALAQGRTVVLMPPVLGSMWARELVGRPGVIVAQDAGDVVSAFRG